MTASRPPVPSLLRSLLFDHLDHGYAAAAREREQRQVRPRRWVAAAWLGSGALAVGALFGVAAHEASARAPDAAHVQNQLADQVRAQQQRNEALDRTRGRLAEQEAAGRSRALAGDEAGKAVLGQLTTLEAAAGATAVHGPGIRVTLSDPAGAPGLSGSGDSRGGGKSVILDRDLQEVVNALWASGAEAVAVDDVRIGPSVTVRQAGGAMLVDNQPVSSPYRISAIGPPTKMQTRFIVSDAYLRLQSVHQLYDVGFSVDSSDDMKLAGAGLRPLRFAKEAGGR